MANKTILELTDINTLQTGDKFPIARPGTTTSNNVSIDEIKRFVVDLVEQVAAQAIAENASKIEALETALSQGIFNEIKVKKLTVSHEFNQPQ